MSLRHALTWSHRRAFSLAGGELAKRRIGRFIRRRLSGDASGRPMRCSDWLRRPSDVQLERS